MSEGDLQQPIAVKCKRCPKQSAIINNVHQALCNDCRQSHTEHQHRYRNKKKATKQLSDRLNQYDPTAPDSDTLYKVVEASKEVKKKRLGKFFAAWKQAYAKKTQNRDPEVLHSVLDTLRQPFFTYLFPEDPLAATISPEEGFFCFLECLDYVEQNCAIYLNYVKPNIPRGRSRESFLACLSLLSPEKSGRKLVDSYKRFEATLTVDKPVEEKYENGFLPDNYDLEQHLRVTKTTSASRKSVAKIKKEIDQAVKTLDAGELRRFYSDMWWDFLKKIYEYVDPDVYDPYHGFLIIVNV